MHFFIVNIKMNYLKYGLLLLLLFCSNLVFSKEAVICNSCFSVTEFKSFTQGYHGNIVGTRDYQVVNYATEEVWDVTVTGWYDDIDFEGNPYGGNGIFLSYAEAELPSLSNINDVKALISAFKNEGDHLVVLPPNSPIGGHHLRPETNNMLEVIYLYIHWDYWG